ncbi:MAG: hypothetical protein AAGJ83_13705, partial [Planctomycetota bacterium]
MKVVENTSERMILEGTPGSVRWMVFTMLLGITVMAAAGGFIWVTVRESYGYLQLIPLGMGFLFGVAFFLVGLVTLAMGRMRLVLDREQGSGIYEVFSPVIDVGRPCSFDLDSIESVTVEREKWQRSKSERHSDSTEFCRVRLRIRRPRRAITLDETQNGRDERIHLLASTVADWLGMP